MNLKLKIFLPLGVLILIAVTGLSAWTIYQLGDAIQYERKSKLVESLVQSVYRYLQEAESAQRKYLLTTKSDYQKSLMVVLPKIPRSMQRLGQLVQGDSDQEERLETLQELIDLKLEDLKIPDGLPETERERLALAVTKTEKEEGLMREIHQVLDELDQSAKQNTRLHEAFARKYTFVLIATIMTGSLTAILLVLFFAYFSWREIRMRIQTENELKAAQQAALIASKLKSQFLATVSHEIRTPLNGIIGMSELLKQKIKNAEQRRFVEIICDSGEALLRIVNDILDFSKIEAGKIDLEFTEFSVLRTVEQVAELLSVKAHQKKLALSTYVDAKIPVSVSGDSTRISQILSNLVGNAIKFTSDGGVFVSAKLKSETSPKAVVRFEICDTGPGISPNIQPLLFQPFNSFRSGDRKHEGTGLGLSICRNLVQQMGGEIGVYFESGKGSVFWFEIPLQVDGKAVIGDLFKASRPWKSFTIAATFGRADRALRNYARELNIEVRTLRADAETAGPGEAVFEFDYDVIRSHAFGDLRLPFSRELFFNALNGLIMTDRAAGPKTEALKTKSPGLILLVEDNMTNQILAKAILEELGYRVHAVANGEEALEALTRINYDLILMDGQMPVMDGYEATRRIRMNESNTGRRTPIVAMTANASEADRENCLSVGMDDFIAKPFKSAELHRKIENWLGGGNAIFDWQVLEDLAHQTNSAVVDRLVASFLTTLPQTLDQIRHALGETDPDGVRRAAHHLKSSAASLGAVKLAELCEKVEKMAADPHAAKDLPNLIGDLIECGEKAESELRHHREAG